MLKGVFRVPYPLYLVGRCFWFMGGLVGFYWVDEVRHSRYRVFRLFVFPQFGIFSRLTAFLIPVDMSVPLAIRSL